MSTIEAMRQEFEREAETTRRVLDRVPGDRLGWKPHDKSWSLGQLALHVATVPGAIAELSQKSPFQIPRFEQPSAGSTAELQAAFDRSLMTAREILGRMNDESLGA